MGINKVLLIVGVQLGLTFIGVFAASASCGGSTDDLKLCLQSPLWSAPMVWGCMLGAFVLLIGATCCCQSMLRKVPHNFAFLAIWTLLETHTVAFISLRYDPQVVTMAFGTTAIVVIAVALITWFTPLDFTKCMGFMVAILFAWFFVTVFGLAFGLGMSRTLYAGIGVTIFTIFLAIDLKMVVGGGKYEYGEEDYVFAAINIYLDIINIFIYRALENDG